MRYISFFYGNIAVPDSLDQTQLTLLINAVQQLKANLVGHFDILEGEVTLVLEENYIEIRGQIDDTFRHNNPEFGLQQNGLTHLLIWLRDKYPRLSGLINCCGEEYGDLWSVSIQDGQLFYRVAYFTPWKPLDV